MKTHEALTVSRKERPETYIMKRKTIFETLRSENGETQNTTKVEFNQNFLNVHNYKTIVILGPSGIGKTSFALAQFKKPRPIKSLQCWSKISEDPSKYKFVEF